MICDTRKDMYKRIVLKLSGEALAGKKGFGLDAEREASVREHAAVLDSELADFERLTSALKRQRDVLLPLAAEKVDLAMADWQGGRGTLSDVINARRERIDAKLKLIQINGERSEMAARLYYAYGEHAGVKP